MACSARGAAIPASWQASQPAITHDKWLRTADHGLLVRYHDRFTAEIANFPTRVRAATSDPNRRADSAPGPRRFTHFGAAARAGSCRSASARGHTRGRHLVVDVRRQRLLRLQLPAAEVRRFLGVGVAELVHARRRSQRRCRTSGRRGHAVARAVHDARRTGSPQLFQTGESYQRTPIVNYQHPHDLLMELGATYRLERPRVRYVFGADLVGSPTLGPTPFMHRRIGAQQPAGAARRITASTRRTSRTGVVRVGVETGPMTFEASAFRGAEPDENRLNIERPRARFVGGRASAGSAARGRRSSPAAASTSRNGSSRTT